MATTVPGQLLAAIRTRKFTHVARMFAPDVRFEGWTPAGHWVAEDATTAAKVIEAWFAPGNGVSTVTFSNEIAGARGLAILEFEMTWKAPPDDQPRALRQVYLMTIKAGKIAEAHVYCAGLHTEFPDVDIDKQRRTKGLAPMKPAAASGKVAAARAS
jgi:hypothetical protein